MKKIIILFAIILLPVMAGAQAQITTKKVKIGDFTQKVTKVVLNGNPFYDTSLKEEVAARWRVSPYEFCTLEEFDNLRGNDNYYFLMLIQGQFRKETAPGLQFLSLVKGGDGAGKGIHDMLEVVSLPFASAEYPSGRELIFLPAFLDIIQNHTLEAMENDFNAYGGLSNTTRNLGKSGRMNIVFSEDDLNEMTSEPSDVKIIVMDEDEADGYMLDNVAGSLVSYVVAPTEPVKGSYCYKMLIDAQTHELYYYRRHKITDKAGSGFLPEDIEKITKARK